MTKEYTKLRLIFGDQLDSESAIFHDVDKKSDAFWMAEVDEEISYVPSHKQRIVFFLSAMRHFRNELVTQKYNLLYHHLTSRKSADRGPDFAHILKADIKRYQVERICVVQPGDYRIEAMLEDVATQCRLCFLCRREKELVS